MQRKRWSLVVIMMGCCEVVRTGLDVFYCFVAAVMFIEVFCHRVIHIVCFSVMFVLLCVLCTQHKSIHRGR